MPSKLSKVQKRVTKKKGPVKSKALHENSRDAKRLRNAAARDEKVANVNSTKQKQNRAWLDRVSFFQDNLPDTLHPLDVDHIKTLILQFLGRYDEELAALKAERRAGRPPSTRQTLLEQHIKAEGLEFDSGFWVPNMQDEATLQRLDEWTGLWQSLNTMHFSRVDRNGSIKDSQFPPRGAS